MSVPSITRISVCSSCGLPKPETPSFFFRSEIHRATKQCKTCRGIQAKTYYRENKEKARALRRRYYKQNSEELLAKKKRYRADNIDKSREIVRRSAAKHKDKGAAQKKRYRDENKEEIAAQAKVYRQKNKDKINAWFRAHYRDNKDYYAEKDRRRRAQKRGNGYEPYGKADIFDMWYEQEGLCYYCQTPLFASYDIEHKLPISRGGRDALDNICLSCKPCNWAKRTKTAEEYLELLRQE